MSFNRRPLVVIDRSSIPSIAAIRRASAGRSRRRRGSPPVSRISRTPSEARTRASRSISSNVRIRSLPNQGMGPAGMQ
jgi:hypothetical protein